MRRLFGVWPAALILAAACSNRPPDPAKQTTKPTYDKTTGKLTQLTYDRNGNGVIDTWTDMDGAKPLRSRIDANEDGRPDRWEYYDEAGKLLKVGFSRKDDGKPDAWAYAGADGSVERVEVSSKSDEKIIDRWEFYKGGQLVRVEEDTNADGRVNVWETYEGGALKTTTFDEDGDGRPDRRLSYRDGALAFIESAPDASGNFKKRVDVK
jgi:antitoxin component YwqK of YwqJK toxin-antitoxin module